MFSFVFVKMWLEQCLDGFKLVILEDMQIFFVLFRSCDHLIKSRNYLNKCHPNTKFSFEKKKKNWKLSFLDVEVSREGNKFVTTAYRKPNFSGVYTHFDKFLPGTTYKFRMIYTLAFRCFSIYSNRTNFHNELVFLKDIF